MVYLEIFLTEEAVYNETLENATRKYSKASRTRNFMNTMIIQKISWFRLKCLVHEQNKDLDFCVSKFY